LNRLNAWLAIFVWWDLHRSGYWLGSLPYTELEYNKYNWAKTMYSDIKEQVL
jgi:hypothetical protein